MTLKCCTFCTLIMPGINTMYYILRPCTPIKYVMCMHAIDDNGS